MNGYCIVRCYSESVDIWKNKRGDIRMIGPVIEINGVNPIFKLDGYSLSPKILVAKFKKKRSSMRALRMIKNELLVQKFKKERFKCGMKNNSFQCLAQTEINGIDDLLEEVSKKNPRITRL